MENSCPPPFPPVPSVPAALIRAATFEVKEKLRLFSGNIPKLNHLA